MTESEQILRMIETVDPNDSAKMDEIDSLVYNFLYPPRIISESVKVVTCSKFDSYTRSRDALKDIRPDLWVFECTVSTDMDHKLIGHGCCGYRYMGDDLESFDLPTEELAELHAIIQAIDYERRLK